jgi:hypothetical protein
LGPVGRVSNWVLLSSSRREAEAEGPTPWKLLGILRPLVDFPYL